MRTTITLDPDVAAILQNMTRERAISFKEAVNAALRRGLSTEATTTCEYRVPARAMGLRNDVDADRGMRLAGELEDAEIARKLELRK